MKTKSLANGLAAALAQSVIAQNAPNMPARNPWLTDSVYPTSHFNPGATNSVLQAGPTKGKKLVRDKNVKVVPNLMVSNPTVKKSASDTVLFASGTLGVRKILATGTAFENVSFTPYPGMEEMAKKADDKALAAGAISRGSGTTPTLMGFGDDPDKLIVIADAAESGTNTVAFWRDEIPADFKQKPGTKSRRVADQARIEISQLTIEPSPNVLGYGVVYIKGAYPKPVPHPGFPNGFTAGVTRPAPLGVEKFTWNTKTHQFEKAWINKEVDNTDIMVPVVSAKTGLLYRAHKENGDYQSVGLDWMTGELKERWIFPDDSRLWNAFGSITTILENGDLLIGVPLALSG